LSGVSDAASDGALLSVRCDGEVAGSMRLTKRCLDLFRMLRAARWLTTAQIHRRFFSAATLDAARKRLRKLTDAGYFGYGSTKPFE